jgi:hypothetical protein
MQTVQREVQSVWNGQHYDVSHNRDDVEAGSMIMINITVKASRRNTSLEALE